MKPLYEFDEPEIDDYVRQTRSAFAEWQRSPDQSELAATVQTQTILLRELARLNPERANEIKQLILEMATFRRDVVARMRNNASKIAR